MRRALWWVAIPALIIGAVAVAGGFRRSSSPGTRAAPGLPSTVLVGPRVDLASLRGRPVVVNFWASWCAPCRREAPTLERLARHLGHRARVVGVNWNDAADGARSFVRQYGWKFPNLRDDSGSAGENYGIRGLPTTFVIDASGRISRTLPGPQSVRSIDAALRGARGHAG